MFYILYFVLNILYFIRLFLKNIWERPFATEHTKSFLPIFSSVHHFFTWGLPELEASPLTTEGICYYLFYVIHLWRIVWSSYRRLAWLGWLNFFLIHTATISAIYIYLLSICIYIYIYICIYILRSRYYKNVRLFSKIIKNTFFCCENISEPFR